MVRWSLEPTRWSVGDRGWFIELLVFTAWALSFSALIEIPGMSSFIMYTFSALIEIPVLHCKLDFGPIKSNRPNRELSVGIP